MSRPWVQSPAPTKTKTNKAQKCGKHGSKWTMKRILVYGMRNERRRQNVALFDLCWKCACWAIRILCLSSAVHKHYESAVDTDLGVFISNSLAHEVTNMNLQEMRINFAYMLINPQIMCIEIILFQTQKRSFLFFNLIRLCNEWHLLEEIRVKMSSLIPLLSL